MPNAREPTEPPSPENALSVIVFAFNEGPNIAPVLGGIAEWLRDHEPLAELVFVDDGSSDDTAAVAETTLADAAVDHAVVRRARNGGIGAALKSGVAAATRPWVTFLPADGQIHPSALAVLRTAATEESADVVLSLYTNRNDGAHRTVLSWGVRSLIRAIHGVRVESDGPYLFRRSLFDAAQLPADSFFLNFEFPIRAVAAGLRIATVTIECHPRLSGQSKSASARVVGIVARDLVGLRLRRNREAIERALGRALPRLR
ncbi:MAG: glycosyltransferase family 2 protein [Myxococcota bacterium]